MQQFARDIRGNVAVMTAIVMGMLLLAVGAAIDYSRMSDQSGNMQNMADAAVLAAARSGEDDLEKLQKIAETVIATHNLDGPELSIRVRQDGDNIVVDIVSDYQMVMNGMLGSEGKPISVSSAAPMLTSSPIDLALVLDTTGSMAGPNIIALKDASLALLNELEDSEEETKVAIVPFGQYVNVGDMPMRRETRNWIDRSEEGQHVRQCWINRGGRKVCNRRITKWHGCMGTHENDAVARRAALGTQKAPAAMDEYCGSELMPLSRDFRAMKVKITTLMTGGTTYLPGGLIWGWRTLDRNAPYTEAASSEPDTMRAMLFMTDGANNRSRGDDHANSSGTKHRYAVDAGKGGLGLTEDICDAAKVDGIRIYVVAYKLPGATSTKSVLSDCASGPDTFFEPESSQELIETFTDIARNLNNLRLAY